MKVKLHVSQNSGTRVVSFTLRLL